AKHYFGVDAKSLTWPQAALLAGMVKNPTGYDPTDNPDAAIARRATVFDRIVAAHYLTPAQAAQYKESSLGLHVQTQRNGCLGSKAEFFCQYVLNYLAADPAFGATEADRMRLLQTGGLTIRTTLDQRFQNAAQKAVNANVAPTDQAVGALAMVQPGTGNVKSLAQSRPMGTNRHKGQSYLNYLVPKEYGDANGFQAGSTFKVFVLTTAISRGFPMHQNINSPPEKTFAQSSFQNCPGAGNYAGPPWEVHNSTTSGQKNLYTGTRESVNTFYAQMEQKTGVCQPYALAKKMGVELTDPAHERVPSFTLGIADVSPLEMAGAYATFAARGKHCDNRPVTAVDGADGRRLKTYGVKCEQVMAPTIADAVSDVLHGVMSKQGFGSHLLLRVPAAAKTGTISGNKAVWFDGYTPALATASVIAGATYSGTQISLNGQRLRGRYINDAAGSTVAGPMWADAMRTIAQWLPYRNFVKPPKSVVDGHGVAVPSVKGMSLAAAEKRLRAAGFRPVVGKRVKSRSKAGTVVGASPGGKVAKGTPITLTVSRGKR
ncbi:MAG: PASTA domain-containing protein, partial [Nocardioides sp.]|nr:PASTA domain-containing protein [Nocardioides sp.]